MANRKCHECGRTAVDVRKPGEGRKKGRLLGTFCGCDGEQPKPVANRIVKYEVTVRVTGDGDILGLPDTIGEAIRSAVQHSENEGTLSGGAEDASAHLIGVSFRGEVPPR